MRRIIILVVVLGLAVSTWACFDVFLLRGEGSMVYPKGTLALESFGEYSVNSVNAPGDDSFLMFGRVYYGVSQRFSFSLGFGSDDSPRTSLHFNTITASGTFNLVSDERKSYSIDGILACQNTIGDGLNAEISAPLLVRKNNYSFVFHPVMEFLTANAFKITPGFHVGLFRTFDNGSIVGVGAEYQSGQEGPYFSRRLIDGEAGVSLFLGAMLGKHLFLQNEIAKGLANSRDLGFALSLKVLFGGR